MLAFAVLEMAVNENNPELSRLQLSGDSLESDYGAVGVIALVAEHIPALGGLKNMEAANSLRARRSWRRQTQ